MRAPVSRVLHKIIQIFHLATQTRTPLPLILDSLRLRTKPYVARLRSGEAFHLEGRRGDWFTLYECCIRKDYLKHGISLETNSQVIDVGANFGAFSVVASRIVGPHGRVIAFEPSPETYERLCRNLDLNGCTNVTAINEAASDSDGDVDFFIFDKSAFSSLSDRIDGRDGGASEKITVRSRRFADFLRAAGPTRLLKIDCEGGEYPIFASSTKADFGDVDQITMELHTLPDHRPEEVIEKLQLLGFLVKRTHPVVALRRTAED